MEKETIGGEKPVRIAAVGDIHVHETSVGHGRDLFHDMADHADILLLCGDLTNRGHSQEAEVLAQELSTLRLPILAVLGNHDLESGHEEEVRRILCQAGVCFLEQEECVVKGVGFAGVKGFCGGFDRHMLTPWGEQAIKHFVREAVDEALQLEEALFQLKTEHKIVVLHYAPIRGTVEGEPLEIYPFLGSSRLVEPIDRFGASAVFHGHAHTGTPEGRTLTGVPVYNVSLPLMRQVNPSRPYGLLELAVRDREAVGA